MPMHHQVQAMESASNMQADQRNKRDLICMHCGNDISHYKRPQGHRARCKKKAQELKEAEEKGESIICPHCGLDISELASPYAHRHLCKKKAEAQAQEVTPQEQGGEGFCPHCNKDISGLKQPRSHTTICEKKKKLREQTRGLDPVVDQLSDADLDISSSDISPTAEQIVSKSRVLLDFSDIIQSLSRSELSPRTAAASIGDLRRFPKLHNIVAHLEDNGPLVVAYLRAANAVLPPDAQDDPKQFSLRVPLIRMTPENAALLVRRGIAPILERILVPPHQLSHNPGWLLNAAKMLAKTPVSKYYFIYHEPAIIVSGGRVCAMINISGFSPDSPDQEPWKFQLRVDSFLVDSSVDITIPNEGVIRWKKPRTATNLDAAAEFKSTPG